MYLAMVKVEVRLMYLATESGSQVDVLSHGESGSQVDVLSHGESGSQVDVLSHGESGSQVDVLSHLKVEVRLMYLAMVKVEVRLMYLAIESGSPKGAGLWQLSDPELALELSLCTLPSPSKRLFLN